MKERIMGYLSSKTWRIRFSLVKLLIPRAYKEIESLPRPMIKFIDKTFKKEALVGVEIGVCYGENSEKYLKNITHEETISHRSL